MTKPQRFKLNKQKMSKVGKGLLIAMIGAGLTYLTDTIPNVELGEFAPLVAAAFAVLANLVRKYVAK